jgi:hypothetical protein
MEIHDGLALFGLAAVLLALILRRGRRDAALDHHEKEQGL